MDYSNRFLDESGKRAARFEDADFSMYFIQTDRSDFHVQNLLDNVEFETCRVQVSIPKFKMEYGKKLNDIMKALGIHLAFDRDRADLFGIVKKDILPSAKLWIEFVHHKTYVDVNEEGTEAAAVTGVGGGGGCKPDRPELTWTFTADSPFYFAIRDNHTKEILFVGQYVSVPK